MAWWMWLVFGFSLLLFEVLAPAGFYLFFFGLSAIVVAMLVAAEIGGPLWLQGLLFAIFAVAGLVLFRKPLMEKLHRETRGKDVDSLVGETSVAMNDIAVDGIGQVELRGSAWRAQNVGAAPLAKGQFARVERVDGLTLRVRGQ
jgi:membrane protein implicated in regulation of membrane protease activity